MKILMRAYRAPKAGRTLGECEDSVGYSKGTATGAVSDGASASARAAEWSAELVRAFLAASLADRLHFERWWEAAKRSFDSFTPDTPDDGWWSDEVTRRGSFATFVGLALGRVGGDLEWRALAVGDSCCFHVRGERLLAAFPLTQGIDFNSTPHLVSSLEPPARVNEARGRCLPGDALLLASDALAHWALSRSDDLPEVWPFLCGLRSDSFPRFVDAARQSGELEDDDVALLRCEVRG